MSAATSDRLGLLVPEGYEVHETDLYSSREVARVGFYSWGWLAARHCRALNARRESPLLRYEVERCDGPRPGGRRFAVVVKQNVLRRAGS